MVSVKTSMSAPTPSSTAEPNPSAKTHRVPTGQDPTYFLVPLEFKKVQLDQLRYVECFFFPPGASAKMVLQRSEAAAVAPMESPEPPGSTLSARMSTSVTPFQGSVSTGNNTSTAAYISGSLALIGH